MTWFRTALSLVLVAAIAAGGCSTPPVAPREPAPAPRSVLRSASIDRALEDRILALDPESISADDVRHALAMGPTPHIVLIHGGIYPVHLAMVSFGRFLTGKGYPEDRIRDPRDRSWSVSPYASASQIAGVLAWYYEHEGVRPMMVGHSQGGIQAVKVLHELAGAFASELHPVDPRTEQAETATTIVDPLTGGERPVVGVSLSYTAVVGAGGWALILPNHWIVVGRVRTIPDTVAEFDGYRIGVDFFAWDVPGLEALKTFHPSGTAIVRNVTLPAEYSHVLVPVTADLAQDPAVHAWIDAYRPGKEESPVPMPDGYDSNRLFAADVWYSIKKHWAQEAQRFVRARRALSPG
jgi:hypothetical protein